MNQVYKHRRMAPDELLGRIEADGRAYESRFGPDRYVGRVELESGKIYESRLGPDRHIGRVDPDSGKVYLAKTGPDEYLGRVHKDGKLYHHRRNAADEYLGRVVEMSSRVHGGAAFLLLIIPVHTQEAEELAQTTPEEPDADEAAASA